MIYIKSIASGSSGNAYRVSDGRTQLLIEAGIPISKIKEALGYTLRTVDACLISHEHGDHISSAAEIAKNGIDVYASQGTLEAKNLNGHRFHEVKPLSLFEVGSFTIMPFPVQHDAVEPVGFLIRSSYTGEKLLYFTDTYYLKYNFTGLNYIMGECNYERDIVYRNIAEGIIDQNRATRLMKSHMSLTHFLEFLRSTDLSQVRQIYLLHLSSDNSDAEMFRREVQKLTGTEVYVA